MGTHATLAAVPVGTTELAVTFGASGGVIVVTEFDLTHEEARLPRLALTLYTTVPAGAALSCRSSQAGSSPSVLAVMDDHVLPLSVER